MEHTFVKIAAGKVTLESGGYLEETTTFDVPSFEIGKYPITNGQYARFVEAKGYNQKQWWTEAGWAQRESRKWETPRYWTDSRFTGDIKPVVGVSWYEAMAFCQWMSETTGQNITLPTEQQWQRAAQAMPDGSDSGYAYAWGDEWDGTKCNNHSNQTTEVTQFEKAGNISPCGVVDLTGNVWEWCLTEWDTGNNETGGDNNRVIRGGSWVSTFTYLLRSASRFWGNPLGGNFNDGFRVVRLND